MFEFARENDVLIANPCKKSLKSDMGKPSDKKEALTIDVQKKFLEAVVGYSYENQYRFVLQTGLRTGELIGLRWSDIDFENRTMKIERTMEYRYKVGEWRVGSTSRANLATVQFLLQTKQFVFLKTRDQRIRA